MKIETVEVRKRNVKYETVRRSLLDADIDKMAQMIDLNITALVRLTYAVMPAFIKRGKGTIINIGSVVGIAPELLNGE